MEKSEVEEILFGKDTTEVLAKFREVEQLCEKNSNFYPYFDSYLRALHAENSCVRGRGFKLILRNAKWDSQNLINQNIEEILSILDDDKPTVVRQCLPLVSNIGKYKQELVPVVKEKLKAMNPQKYKESMQNLVKRDIEKAQVLLNLE